MPCELTKELCEYSSEGVETTGEGAADRWGQR